jgi:hypothetical protein
MLARPVETDAVAAGKWGVRLKRSRSANAHLTFRDGSTKGKSVVPGHLIVAGDAVAVRRCHPVSH